MHRDPVPQCQPDSPPDHPPSSPAAIPQEVHVLVSYVPQIEDARYRLFVPFGQSVKVVAQMDGGDGYFCDQITVSQGDDPWFVLGLVENPHTQTKNGILCDVLLAKETVTFTITNKYSSQDLDASPIVLRVIPRFTNGKTTRTGKDPQIVLPPEKVSDVSAAQHLDEDVQSSG